MMRRSLARKGTSLALAGIAHRPVYQAAQRFSPKAGLIVVVALMFSLAAVLVSEPFVRTMFGMVSALLMGCVLWFLVLKPRQIVRRDREAARMAALIQNDPVPVIVAHADGRLSRPIRLRSAVSQRRMGPCWTPPCTTRLRTRPRSCARWDTRHRPAGRRSGRSQAPADCCRSAPITRARLSSCGDSIATGRPTARTRGRRSRIADAQGWAR